MVEIGIDLREYYPSVEWDILGVPAERHEKCELLENLFSLMIH